MTRARRLRRILFHTGALVSLIIATVLVALWIRGTKLSDRWTWVTTTVDRPERTLRCREWELEFIGGSIRAGRVTRDTRVPPDIVVSPSDNGFFHTPNLPGRTPSVLVTLPIQPPPTVHYLLMLGNAGLGAEHWTTTKSAVTLHRLVLPIWSALLVSLLWPASWELLYRRRLYLRARDRWRRQHHLCPTCGYDLRATPTQCPECGFPHPTHSTPTHAPPLSPTRN